MPALRRPAATPRPIPRLAPVTIAAEDLGFESLAVYDHVLSARPEGRSEPWLAMFHEQMFHEPFVLFGYLAGVTRRIVFTTKVLTLPERQTALVAKQAAEVDVISGGRVRLVVGVGWNTVDFEGMGQDFRTRAQRMEEQIEVLRLLWTEPLVTASDSDLDCGTKRRRR